MPAFWEFHLRQGNVFDANADILVIPHSSSGTMSEEFSVPLNENGIHYIPSSAPGEVLLHDLGKAPFGGFKQLMFACSVDQGRRSYAILRKIGRGMAQLMVEQKGRWKIAAPLLGTGASDLRPDDAAVVLLTAFNEVNRGKDHLMVYLNSPELFSVLMNLSDPEPYNSLQHAFRASFKLAIANNYIRELAASSDYYFQLAEDKFMEFERFSQPSDFYSGLLEKGEALRSISFGTFLQQFNGMSEEYKILKLCGELVAYIDAKGYNKAEWNQYKDKRTIAQASVRQPHWIRGLLRYKMLGALDHSISASVANAIRFLKDPADELTMLSFKHRTSFFEKIFLMEYTGRATLTRFFEFTKEYELPISHYKNRGFIYSAIIYFDDIKQLWLPEPASTDDLEDADTEIEIPVRNEDSPVTAFSRPNGQIEATIHSDLFAEEDLLNYNAYARSIARFITHPNTTPPLTVGILAPWGKGKTTLMKLIAKNVREIVHQSTVREQETIDSKQKSRTTFKGLLELLKQDPADLLRVKPLRFPTVWFNAWNFQKTEQIWAGFGYTIIEQLISQLPDKIEREKAWLALNIKRIDTASIRQEAHKKLFDWLGTACVFLFAAAAIFIGSYFLNFSALLTVPGAGLAGAGYFIFTYFKKIKEPIDFQLGKYVREPAYRDKTGSLFQLKEDMRLVLNLLVEQTKPVIIFIDDLDRCTPSTTSEVAEAINAFISGDLPHCHFILGQDAQMVAAALDVSYEKMSDKLGNVASGHGSLGWFFMEKFIQLQFNIPAFSNADTKKIMTHLLHAGRQAGAGDPVTLQSEKLFKNAMDKIQAKGDDDLTMDEEIVGIENQLKEIAPEKALQLRDKLVDKAALSFRDEDDEVTGMIEQFSPHLAHSPRMVKRFINLYRFYRFIQFSGQNQQLQNLSSQTVGKWIVIMLKWPQLVRAIQWDTEQNFFNGNNAKERAGNFEKELDKCTDFAAFTTGLTPETKKISWLVDKKLFTYLKESKSNESSLVNAVEVNFW